jgi:glycerophosphoryl diester phosphodiesterase
VFRSAWHDFRRAWRALFLYEVLFKLFEAWLLVPSVALVLAAVMAWAGHVAVSNQDLLDFLLSPSGLLYAALFSVVAVAALLLEQSGIMVIVAMHGSAERPPLRQALRAAFLKTWRVLQLGAILVALLALTFAPFAFLLALTYKLFLSQHDINYYLTDRPPEFWLAAGIGVVLLLSAVAVALVLYVRWAFALPILLFERRFAHAALRAGRERVRGSAWQVGFVLVGWQLTTLLLGAAVLAGFRVLAAAVLSHAGERPIVPILILLIVQAALLASISFVRVVGHGLVTRQLYLRRNEQLGLLPPGGSEPAPDLTRPVSLWDWRLAWLSLPLFLMAPLLLWANLSRYVVARPLVRVTAHRGHSHAAPENTLIAVRKAIASGADYAEVDVQLTADGVVVLLHDRDLKRVAGDPRRLEDLTIDQVRQLDVGRWFDPSFAGERVPTLVEVINLCRGRIKLNIEMKFYGPDRRLAGEVARLVQDQDFESGCLVTSFNYDALLELKRHNGRLRTGIIVAYALGDVSQLEVDALSVRADFLSDGLLRSARRHNREVHVWTVNDAGQMTRLMKRGVDNILTDDPDLLIRVRGEWTGLTQGERLVSASRLLLGLDP